jgi:hypothetical protein
MPAHQVQAQLEYAAHLLERGTGAAKLAELVDHALAGARALGASALVARALATRSALERSRS